MRACDCNLEGEVVALLFTCMARFVIGSRYLELFCTWGSASVNLNLQVQWLCGQYFDFGMHLIAEVVTRFCQSISSYYSGEVTK